MVLPAAGTAGLVADPPAPHARVLSFLPFVLLAALVATAITYALQLAGTNHRADGQQAALQAAVREAVNLTTISYTSADRDLSRIIAGATGNLRTQFDHERAQFPGVLSGEKSVSRGTVLRAGLQSFTGTTAIALVAVDATVSNTASVAAGTPSVVKHYRMVMTLRLVRGTWLVSDVAFAGLPQ